MPDEAPRQRWLLVCGTLTGPYDAIHAYSVALASALRSLGCDAEVIALAESGGSSGAGWKRETSRLRRADVIVLQYSPYSFGRRGLAPHLARDLRALRRTTERPQLMIMCHERYVPMSGLKWTILGLVQRLQLAAVLRSADHVAVSVSAWRRHVARLAGREAHHIPVGSNLPDRSSRRQAARAALLGVRTRPVIACFGTGHLSTQDTLIAATARLLSARSLDFLLLTLGARTSSVLDGVLRAHEIRPGPQSAGDLADHLSAADLFISTYIDGVSTRRGTVVAALQHGVPVAGTYGESTDPELLASRFALHLMPADCDERRFAEHVVTLVTDPELLKRSGEEARRLHEERFAWAHIAASFMRLAGSDGTPL